VGKSRPEFAVSPIRCAKCGGAVEKIWLEDALCRKIPGAEKLQHLKGYCLLHCQSCGHLSQSGVGKACQAKTRGKDQYART